MEALEAAGYDRSFDVIQAETGTASFRTAVGERGAPRRPLKPPTHGRRGTDPAPAPALRLKAGAHTIQLGGGVRLDLGGIAKGWAADRAAHRLRRLGPALVDAGGDIAVNGPMANGDPWPIGVVDPFNSASE